MGWGWGGELGTGEGVCRPRLLRIRASPPQMRALPGWSWHPKDVVVARNEEGHVPLSVLSPAAPSLQWVFEDETAITNTPSTMGS